MIVIDPESIQEAVERSVIELTCIDISWDDVGVSQRSAVLGCDIPSVVEALTKHLNQVLKEKQKEPL